MSIPPRLAYSIRETCAVLPVGKTKLFAMIKAGELRVVRIGGRTLVPASSLQALLEGGNGNG
ncbi:helix-turn-helix domain-containing protein [Sandarakinorhabdus limnophila]|uniref:helix-turn-helix domain-containing protein n=1 Tax=Sandarakinorhabdus limnophila TaxID=210512 RepID=UPI0034C5FF7D